MKDARGQGVLGKAASLELISKSQAACHAFLVCFVFFCFSCTDVIIFSRAYVLHEPFKTALFVPSVIWAGCLGDDGRGVGGGGNQEVSQLSKNCATVT